ncbi:MAG: transglutaminase domain-containing protein [Candidatus Gastranaerophilales bacterium]|nr:transglutaminase domain-containing protein [Candidatus Gastranaerophilales bacterium]
MKKKKKKQERDFSALGYIFLFAIMAGFMVFLMYFSTNQRSKDVTVPQKQEAKINLQKPATEKPTLGNNLQNFETYNYRIAYTFDIQGTINDVFFRIPIPTTENEKQYILNSNTSIKPTKIYYDGATTFAEFNFPELKTQKLTIEHNGTAQVRTYDLKTAKLINKNKNPEKDINRYLKDEQYIEVNDALVKSYAAKIKGDTKEEIIKNIYEFTQNHLTYKHLKGVSGAKKALKDRVGECSEYSAIMVALCRAKGIPARIVIGNIAREENSKHNWVEVYFDEYGWVTFDPTNMPIVVNIYKNGKLVKQEKKLDSNKSISRYIVSGKNLFSPYIFRYKSDSPNTGRAGIKETVEIKKVKK